MLNTKIVDLSRPAASFIHFWLPKGTILEPAQLAAFSENSITSCLPIVPADRGVVLSGRLPVWFFAFCVRCYTTNPWLATYDPRLGVVVVDVFDNFCNPYTGKPIHIGDILPINFPSEDLPC